MNTRILLVDDHQIFLSGLAELIRKTPDMEVVGTAVNGESALVAINEHKPDVVIMDIAMPGINGIQVAQQVSKDGSTTKIICLSMHADTQLIKSMFKAGAAAYMAKDCDLSELIAAVRKVTAGETYMSSSVLKIVTESYSESPNASGSESAPALTEREQQVLVMLADGLSTKQIAGKLQVSIKTIGTHREHLMDKLNIRSVAGLTKYAVRNGLTSSD